MNDAQNPGKTQKLAVGGMTCVNCEILVERRLKALPGVNRVRVDHAHGFAEIEHHGDLDLGALQRAVAEDGYTVAAWDENAQAPTAKNIPRDYAEIAGVFVALFGIMFALQHFGLMPRGLAAS